MHIYIPSLGRATSLKVHLYIPSDIPATVLVSRKEIRQYRKNYPELDFVVCPYDRIAQRKQWALENSHDDIVMFVDDDLKFFSRPDSNSPKLVNLLDSPRVQRRMWRMVRRAFETFPMVGISHRAGNNHIMTPYRDCTKLNACWGVDRRVLFKEGIRIDTTDLMEDFQVCLSLLTRGYKNRSYFRWAWDQWGTGSNAPGGCSTWRTPEIQAENARKLHALFPDYVSLVEKNAKKGWYGHPRLDVRIQWRKAYAGVL